METSGRGELGERTKNLGLEQGDESFRICPSTGHANTRNIAMSRGDVTLQLLRFSRLPFSHLSNGVPYNFSQFHPR